jgi:aminoglycoside phosphotransferase (APT) family kinase protein
MPDDSSRLRLLAPSVRERLGEASLEVLPWRSGVDFWADLVRRGGHIVGVLRSPRTPVLATSYDGVVDFGAVLGREAIALSLIAQAGIPAPRVLAHSGGDSPWTLLTYVHHDDDASIPRAELGRLTRALHEIRPAVAELHAVPSWSGFVWQRLSRRLAAARRYCRLPDDGAYEPGVLAMLERRAPHADRLLHMDLRTGNVCVRAGRIEAVIDLANCLVGDPLMELGRIRNYGLLDEEFLAGYGRPVLSPEHHAVLDVYELDTAALLTVVAVEEIDDAALHHQQARRAQDLVARILEHLP